MKEFTVTYFFDAQHYVKRFVHETSEKQVEALIKSERDQYISFTDRRGVYHELHTRNVRYIQMTEYHRDDKSDVSLST